MGDDGVAVPGSGGSDRPRVSFTAALVSIVLPVALMLVDAVTTLTVTDAKAPVRVVVDVIGTPAAPLRWPCSSRSSSRSAPSGAGRG